MISPQIEADYSGMGPQIAQIVADFLFNTFILLN